MAIERTEEEPKKEPELPDDGIFLVLWLLLRACGGTAAIPHQSIVEMPPSAEIKHVVVDGVHQFAAVSEPKKRKRAIIKPSRKLILPGG